ncbi:DUF2878 family protein, partial [Caballeronia sp. M23-90]
MVGWIIGPALKRQCGSIAPRRYANQITASRMPDASSNIPDGPARRSAFERWAPTIYFIVGQFGWFACVLSAAHDVPWIGVAVTLVLVAVHLARVDRRVPELKLLASVIVIGTLSQTAPIAITL